MIRPLLTIEFARAPEEAELDGLKARLQAGFAITASEATQQIPTHVKLFAARDEEAQVAAFYANCKNTSAAARQLIEDFGITAISCADDTHSRARLVFAPTAAYGSRATPAPSAA